MDVAAVHAPRRPRRFLKYGLIALATIALLACALIAYVSATFDPRDYHQRIVNIVQEKTGRSLEIRGETALSFWPDVGVRMGALSLSERGSSEIFASIESARITLEPGALLSRELVASELAVTGANVRITRDENGRLNIADLLEGGGETPRFDIGRFAMERSALTYRDLATGAHYELADFALGTGRLAGRVTTPVSLAGLLRDAGETFRVQLKLGARLDLDLIEKRYGLTGASLELNGRLAGVSDLAAQVRADVLARPEAREVNLSALAALAKGTHGEDAITVTLDAVSLLFTPDRTTGEAVRVSLLAKGPAGTTDAKLALPSVVRVSDQIEAAAAALDLTLHRGEHSIRAAAATPLQATVSARELRMTGIVATFTATGPRLPRKGLAGAVKGEARLDAGKEGVHVQLVGKVADSNLKVQLTAAGFASPVYTFAVHVDQLDLDRYAGTTAADRKAQPVTSAQSLLAPLEHFPASGTLTIGVLKSSDIKASNVKLVVK